MLGATGGPGILPRLFLGVPECDGTPGRNEPLRPLKPTEFTDKILKISDFSGPQWFSGWILPEIHHAPAIGDKQTVFGGKRAGGSYLDDEV
jgi:hypothetical protein